MKSTQIEQVLQRMSNFTAALNADLEDIANTDFKNFSKQERANFLKEIEQFELLTSKAEALSQKTSREGVPEIVANQQDNKLDNKLENKAAPKKRASNLMKPGLTNLPSTNPNKKDRK